VLSSHIAIDAELRLYTPPEKVCVDLAVAAFATSSEIIPVLYHVSKSIILMRKRWNRRNAHNISRSSGRPILESWKTDLPPEARVNHIISVAYSHLLQALFYFYRSVCFENGNGNNNHVERPRNVVHVAIVAQ
jgi:hypothetical protein